MSEQTIAEEWRAVNGFPGYEVSDLGRVRSCRVMGGRRQPGEPSKGALRPPRLSGSWHLLKPYRMKNGYRMVTFWREGRPHYRKIHRLVLEVFVGPCPEGMEARHVGSNDRSDNRLANLAWGTPKENGEDQVRHGTTQTGEKAAKNKLKTEQVLEILKLRGKESIARVADRYKVCRTTIRYIWQGVTWKCLSRRG
jgi:hypothetical protein